MLASMHPLGLTDDWSDKLKGQLFDDEGTGITYEHYMQVVLTTIEPRKRPELQFDAYEYTVQSHKYNTGEGRGGGGGWGLGVCLSWRDARRRGGAGSAVCACSAAWRRWGVLQASLRVLRLSSRMPPFSCSSVCASHPSRMPALSTSPSFHPSPPTSPPLLLTQPPRTTPLPSSPTRCRPFRLW